jgi:hypothetical protein
MVFEDGTDEVVRIPAEVWRLNDKDVKKVIPTDKEVAKWVLDPFYEIADINTRITHSLVNQSNQLVSKCSKDSVLLCQTQCNNKNKQRVQYKVRKNSNELSTYGSQLSVKEKYF